LAVKERNFEGWGVPGYDDVYFGSRERGKGSKNENIII
jgi:hypothetical protein